MRIYRGEPAREPGDRPTVTVEVDGAVPAALMPQVAALGFGWGDGSPDAARLAVALLGDALDDAPRAVRLYMRFKLRAVATWSKGAGWTITDEAILRQAEDIEAVERATAQTRRMVQLEPPPVVHEGGIGNFGGRIIWDKTDMPSPNIPNNNRRT